MELRRHSRSVINSHDDFVLVAELKTCAKRKDLQKGILLHNDILRSGSLERNSHLASSLISMYVKCGQLVRAQNVLDEISVRNVVTWNALIAGHVQQGQGFTALNFFKQMKIEGVSPDVATFVCVLKACVLLGSIGDGKDIHEEILNRGRIQQKQDIILGTALVDMYAKCGILRKAYQLLEGLSDRDVVCWNALIAGYAQDGQGYEVLNCFELMQIEGVRPDAVTFICVLKACGSVGAIGKGNRIHEQVKGSGCLQKDIVLATSLLDMYAKCGVLHRAQQALDDLPVRTVVCWNALVTGYCEGGQGHRALHCFQQMLYEGIFPDVVTFLCILKVCGHTKSISKGKQIHVAILLNRGFPNNDNHHNINVLENAVLDMYAKCGMITKAQRELSSLDNVVSYNTLLTAYAQEGKGHEALSCFEQMRKKGHSPNVVTFICILKACGLLRALEKGRQIHDEITVKGSLLHNDIALGNALIDMYAKCGALSMAQEVFDEIPVRDVVSWNALIAGYGEDHKRLACFQWMQMEGCLPDSVTFICLLKACGSARAGMRIHGTILRSSSRCCVLMKDIKLSTALVEMYSQCGMLSEAEKVLKELSSRDQVAWNALIAGYAQHGCSPETLIHFLEQMEREGVSPDAVTFLSMLTACGSTGAVDKGEGIRREIIRRGFLKEDTILGSALVDFYAKCGLIEKAHQVLEELPQRTVISWSAIITGYAQHGQPHRALNCFEQMKAEGLRPDVVAFICILKCCASIRAVELGKQIHEEIVCNCKVDDDVMLGTALVDMYAKCGAFAKAKEILEEQPAKDVVSWNALISAYARQGQSDEALGCCRKMESHGILPDSTTFICLLMACGGVAALKKGQEIHEMVVNRGLVLEKDRKLGVSLISMYASCGALERAEELLLELPFRDATCWNALIGGCAKFGLAREALTHFKRMQDEGIHPDEITLLCIMNACNHSGLLDEAHMLLEDMSLDYGITPEVEHYTCMVMVYGCAGRFKRAMAVIESMPSIEHVSVWLVLLRACRMWGNVELGRLVFDQLFQLEDESNKNCGVGYVLLANIFADSGMKEDEDAILRHSFHC